MVAGTPCQRKLCILRWQRSEKREKYVQCSRMVSERDGGECWHLEAGGIRDITVCGSCLVNMFTAEY